MADTTTTGRVVVGVDGSAASTVALRWAAAEAARRGVGLDMVHAWTTPYPLSIREVFADPTRYEAEGHAVLDDAVATLASADDAPSDVRPTLVQDQPGKALVDAAQDAAVLVVSSRGRDGFRGLLLGSVSQHCLHHGRCPVAVVPQAWGGTGHGPVVVGVDGSPSSGDALRWALTAAAMRATGLDVVNVYDPGAAWIIGVDRDALTAASAELLDEMIDPLLAESDPQPEEVERVAVPANSPAGALLERAARAALLVVGSRGRGAVREALLGSVSHQCVSHARCPVVVVRQH